MLELKDICKTFNPNTINAKVALNHLNLTLNDGDFVTVIGGNGAGKSTMLNAIAGVFQVDSGTITIDGQDVTKLPEHKRAAFLGRVFQDPMMGTAPTMQIEENLALAARRGQPRGLGWGITKTERADYRELLRDLGLGLEDRLTSKVGLLSGGQRQALTLLMASLKRPKLLLLDEHTAALDPKTAAKVLTLSEKIVEENHLTQVASVKLEVGEVSGIIPYYLTDCWKWAVEKSQYLKGAELKIETLPAVTYCEDCKQTYPTVKYAKICPHCKSEHTYLLSGNEYTIKEIEAC